MERLFFVSVSGSASDPERFHHFGLDHHRTKPVALDAVIGIQGENAKLDLAR